MEQDIHNKSCRFYGTKYCRLLNMRSCERCTLVADDDPERIKADLDLYELLLPEGGVARLFESKTCTLCKDEPKGKRNGYALLYMAHPEPKRIQRRLLGKRETAIGTMIPLQFAICKKCRSRLIWIAYLPVVLPTVCGAAGLFLLSRSLRPDALETLGDAATFALWLAMVLLGLAIGALLSGTLRSKAEKHMTVDILKHPVVREMMKNGWFPINRQRHTSLSFSRSRIARGLGTAGGDGEDEE